MVKNQPIELANFSTAGSAAGTFRLSKVVPFQGMMTKRESSECCVVLNLSDLSGTSPTFSMTVYETVDNADILIGGTGTVSGTIQTCLDSGGGAFSYGTAATAGSTTGTLRLLGKGTDMKVVLATGGTIGTIAGTVNVIFYN